MAEVETAQVQQADAPQETDAARPREAEAGAAGPLVEAISIMARLRAPGGCPWDREQTFDTIKRYTLEETYEVFDAIERRAWPDLKDELGDLLLQVLFYAQMASSRSRTPGRWRATSAAWAAILYAMIPSFTSFSFGRPRCSFGVT